MFTHLRKGGDPSIFSLTDATSPRKTDRFKRLLDLEQLQREPSERDYSPLDNRKILTPAEVDKPVNLADPVAYLYHLWALPYQDNLPEDVNLSAFLVAYKNKNKIGHERITRREDIPRTVLRFVNKYRGCNISYLPHLFDTTGFWSKDTLYKTKAFAIDLDIYKSDLDLEDPKKYIFDRLADYRLPKPHFIVNTSEEGRQLVWLTYVENRADKPKLVDNIETLQAKLTKQVFPFADDIHAVQAFRLPGSYNVKEDRDNYRVNYEVTADPDKPVGLYTDLFAKLYKVPNLSDGEIKERKKPAEKVEDPLNHAVIRTYKKRLESYTGYNVGRLLTGAVLALKAIGEGKTAIKDRILTWTDGEHEEELQDSISYAFTGNGADGQLDGKGWDHRKATIHLPTGKLKDFYNYVPNVKRTPKPDTRYQGVGERRRRLVKLFLATGAKCLKGSFKQIANLAGIAESTLRSDVKNNLLPYFIGAEVRHGKVTLWRVHSTIEADSAKPSLYYAYVGADGESDSTISTLYTEWEGRTFSGTVSVNGFR